MTAALRERGKRVLLCDFDPQANSTSGMGVDKTVSQGVYDVLINGIDVKSAVVTTRYGDVLPSSKALAGAGIEMIDLPDRQFRLKKALDTLSPDYDFVFIDCPPSLELLTLNALCAADSLLVPVQGEYYALEGLSDLMNTVRIVRRIKEAGSHERDPIFSTCRTSPPPRTSAHRMRSGSRAEECPLRCRADHRTRRVKRRAVCQSAARLYDGTAS